MSTVLFVVGAIAIVAGAVMIGFGIPVNAFSVGNTLISAGVTSLVGGLIILGLGAVVAQLNRLVEALAVRPPLRMARPLEPFEQPIRSAPASRVPFPPRPKPDTRERPAEIKPEVPREAISADEGLSVAPTLPNPVTIEEKEELLLSPRQTASPAAGMNGSGAEKRNEPVLDAGWRAPPPKPPAAPPRAAQTAFFDAMWPAPERRQPKVPVEAKSEPKPESRFESRFEPKSEFHPEPKPEPKSEQEAMPQAKPEAPAPQPTPEMMQPEPETPSPPAAEKRAVAILKSGVVDGMGYTLYVDGSIEAELPQGTLHFASINELRSHLEKNS